MISDVIPFGEWLPDQAPFMNAGVNVAENVLPDGRNYKPSKELIGNTSALPAECYGGYSFVTDQGTVETFAATSTKLYRLSGGAWVDVTRTSGDYTTSFDIRWRFVNYGNRVLATNYTNEIQSFVIGSSTKFENLVGTGTPPKPKYMALINNFVMTFNIVDPDDNVKGQRLKWCGIDDPTYWADSSTNPQTDIQKQSDFQDVYGDFGLGSGLANLRDYLVAIFERGIVRVQYVGAPLFFSIEPVEFKRGSRVPGSIVSSGQAVFFLAEDGFYKFDGTDSIPIGDKRVDKFFYKDVNPNMMHKIQGTVDPKNKFVSWLYQSNASTNGKPDKLLTYSWVDDRWTLLVDVNATFMIEGLTSSMTLEDVGVIYPNLDLIPYSLDSRIWAGGNNLLSAFTHENKLGVFEGQNAKAALETSETRFKPDGNSLIQGVLPVVDTADCLVSIGFRKLISLPIVYTGDTNTNDETGEADTFVEARYQRARVTINEGVDWSIAQGVRFRVEPAGEL